MFYAAPAPQTRGSPFIRGKQLSLCCGSILQIHQNCVMRAKRYAPRCARDACVRPLGLRARPGASHSSCFRWRNFSKSDSISRATSYQVASSKLRIGVYASKRGAGAEALSEPPRTGESHSHATERAAKDGDASERHGVIALASAGSVGCQWQASVAPGCSWRLQASVAICCHSGSELAISSSLLQVY